MRVGFRDNSQNAIEEMRREIERRLLIFGEKITSEGKRRCAVDTGNLRSSINNQLVNYDRIRIGTNVEYAIYVEKGTRKQQAQPFLLPAAYHVLRR